MTDLEHSTIIETIANTIEGLTVRTLKDNAIIINKQDLRNITRKSHVLVSDFKAIICGLEELGYTIVYSEAYRSGISKIKITHIVATEMRMRTGKLSHNCKKMLKLPMGRINFEDIKGVKVEISESVKLKNKLQNLLQTEVNWQHRFYKGKPIYSISALEGIHLKISKELYIDLCNINENKENIKPVRYLLDTVNELLKKSLSPRGSKWK